MANFLVAARRSPDFLRRLARGAAVLVLATTGLGVSDASARGWVLQPSPRSSVIDSLAGVSCPSENNCTAVGSDFALGSIGAMRLDGGRWRATRLPTPPEATASELTGVSCVSRDACQAVGFSQTGSISAGDIVLLGEHWNGSRWELQRIPAPGDTANLTAVSCAAAHDCMAVGSSGDGLNQAPFAERWDGRRWSFMPMPLPVGEQGVEIDGVSCPAANACIAVGGYGLASGFEDPLAERWNGRRWSIETTIDPDRRAEVTLRSVSCSSRRECVAVGDYLVRGAGYQVPVAEQRNGGLWALYTLPGASETPLRLAGLASVSCRRGGPCSAVGTVGTSGPGGPGGQTLAERWSGLRWSVRPTPSPAASDQLEAVSCPSAATCVAVGQASDVAGNETTPLIERLS